MTRKELKNILKQECGVSPWGEVFISLFPEKHSVFLFRKAQYHSSHKGLYHRFMKQYYRSKLARTYGIHASPNARIGKGLRFVHPTSIVIGEHVIAGENLSIYQNSTIGGARIGDVREGNQPIIGNNVTVFCGAAVLGRINVGSNVTIAANSTLLKDAPDNSVCVGSPARIVLVDNNRTGLV